MEPRNCAACDSAGLDNLKFHGQNYPELSTIQPVLVAQSSASINNVRWVVLRSAWEGFWHLWYMRKTIDIDTTSGKDDFPLLFIITIITIIIYFYEFYENDFPVICKIWLIGGSILVSLHLRISPLNYPHHCHTSRICGGDGLGLSWVGLECEGAIGGRQGLSWDHSGSPDLF